MTEYDVKRLAAILSIQADIDGMKAENMQRSHLKQSMAYTDYDFHELTENLMQLATISNDNLHELILSFEGRVSKNMSIQENSGTFLTVKEACQFLKVSRRTLLRHTKSGRLSIIRLGRKIMYSKEQILRDCTISKTSAK